MNDAPDYAAILSTPQFALGILCNGDEITGIDYLEPCADLSPRSLLAKEAVRQLRAYLTDPNFEFGLPLAATGTPFQRRVWAQISGIPSGRTRSYGEIADAIRSGPRAVGNACGRNPYPLVVPCHRVIATNQGLGGFGRQHGGFTLDIKRWLLRHEGGLPRG